MISSVALWNSGQYMYKSNTVWRQLLRNNRIISLHMHYKRMSKSSVTSILKCLWNDCIAAEKDILPKVIEEKNGFAYSDAVSHWPWRCCLGQTWQLNRCMFYSLKCTFPKGIYLSYFEQTIFSTSRHVDSTLLFVNVHFICFFQFQ